MPIKRLNISILITIRLDKNRFNWHFSKKFLNAKLGSMVLSDHDIKKAIKEKIIEITPLPDFKTQLGSCSIDLRLGDTFRVFEHSRKSYIDPSKKDFSNEVTREIKVKKGGQFI